MSLQFISDDKGRTTGVFIPIEEWNELKNKFKGLEAEELDIPEWQFHEVDNRLKAYKADPSNVQGFNEAMDDIESKL